MSVATQQRSAAVTVLVPILGDQLSHAIASLRNRSRSDTVVLMMEVADEARYVRHHKQKIIFILAAMRHFAAELAAAGWAVDYIRLDDADNSGSFAGELTRAVARHRPHAIAMVEPGEWRVRQAIDAWRARFDGSMDILEDDRFLCSISEFRRWAGQRSMLVMEYFYRDMRRKTGLLMTPDGAPVGGQWNLDDQNRAPPKKDQTYPAPLRFAPDAVTQDVIALVEDRFPDHFGNTATFALPATARQAQQALAHFIDQALPHFGTFQDAMVAGEDLLFHSWLSPALNIGLLTAGEATAAVAAAYEAGKAPLNAAEGFIRQLIGWREYVRGYYWLEMPGVADANALGAERPLPEFFWTGETDMFCLAEAVRNTRDNAYAHHIQRLMVLGNFAMLAGVRPQDVGDWFLTVYADAFEWVELPNVLGMSQYADGGRLGTKPYAGGGAYINRMSNYCGHCSYDVKAKTGPHACPFNALYWDFLARHEDRFRSNRRMANMYASWDRMGPDKQQAYRESAAAFLAGLIAAAPGWVRA